MIWDFPYCYNTRFNELDDIFEIKCLLNNIEIKLCARIENGVKQLLALVTSDGDVVLHYNYGELPTVVKRIPWFSDKYKNIQAVCFDPSASWLLVVSLDGSLYIIPALSLVDKKQKIDCKWSLSDVTHFPKHSQTPNVKPTCVVWWQTLDCNQNALVGFENGAIVVISLTDGRCLGSCTISEAVSELTLYQENGSDIVSLLINGVSNQQWRLILEHHTRNYLWPPDSVNMNDETSRSRLFNLKQLGVEKFASLKQKLSDARGNRRDSQTSDTTSESSHAESNHSEPELLPHLCDTIFEPQLLRNRHYFSAFYRSSKVLTVHESSVESPPLHVYSLPPKTTNILLTDHLIYAINKEDGAVNVVSTELTEFRIESDREEDFLQNVDPFFEDTLIADFTLENEKILRVFKQTDKPVLRARKCKDDDKKEKLYELPKTVDDLNIQKPRVDTCVIVTNCSVYKVFISCSLIEKFVRYVTVQKDISKAEKLATVFNMNLQQLVECCGDLMLSRGLYHEGIKLYKEAKVHLLKRVLKLAITSNCKTLLKFIHTCLSASKVEMSMATKIHIGNLAVMAYTELILRHGGIPRIGNTKDFMNFLCYEDYYDQILAVNVACQAGHWNIVTLLAKSRSLQPEVVSALGQILQSARAPRVTDQEFLLALSEPSLSQSLLISPQSSHIIFQYIRANLQSFPVDILIRLAVQLDPSQPCAVPLVSRLFQTHKHSSSLDTTIESIDLENPDRSVVIVKDFIETFIYVSVYLAWKTDGIGSFKLELLRNIEAKESEEEDDGFEDLPMKSLPDLKPLCCGHEHTAVVRNNWVYTMGISNSGCLGLGPLLTQSSPPTLVQTLSDIKVKALSVSCGRKHTLVLTDFGVYAFGSNSHGQLGLGPYVHESPYPQLLTTLFSNKIVEVAAGQYHSVALTVKGQVFTWGWSVHGQLGHGHCDNEYYPKLLRFKHQVKQVTAGHAHTMILTVDGKLFGFGSNVFGQLESCQIDTLKSTRPVRVHIIPEICTTVEKIATTYFHNIAITTDQEVYTWGASPQEVRIFQSRNNQRQKNVQTKPVDSWKVSVHVYSSKSKRSIEQIAVGYRHTAILHCGQILWGKNKDDELASPKLREEDNMSLFAHRFLHVSCGFDYTMAMDHTGKLLAWGSPSMAQTLMGKPFDDERRAEGKVLISRNTKRIIKFPKTMQGNNEKFPVEVPGLPSMAITFNLTDHKLLLSKRIFPYAIKRVENSLIGPNVHLGNNFRHIHFVPSLKFGQKTLHYTLQTYYGLYDSENILQKCLEVHNYQGASKIAILDGHYGDSLAFQLVAFKKYLESLDVDLASMFSNKDLLDIPEKDQHVTILKNMQDDLNERNLFHSNSTEKISCSSSPARILSSSSSLDSIRQWGDDVEHQGGCESPCDISGDIRHNITQYVQSLQTNENSSPPITSVSKIVSGFDTNDVSTKNIIEIKDKTAKEIIDSASNLVEFYIKKIYQSENHILMQNILLKCIEFWLANNLPVPVLENVLLKNMDKYFYPLSILLFCKNFGSSSVSNEDLLKNDIMKTNSSGFLKEFSTKFCLQLCSMVLENVNKS